MSEANFRQVRVLHVVSSGGVASTLQQSLFMPLLTRTPKGRVKSQVVCLAPEVVPAAVLRQSGIPVHEVALSRRRFSMRGFGELMQATRAFRPDVIQAWGQTAQIVSVAVRKRCHWKPKVVWTVANTAALGRGAGLIDTQKLKWAAKLAPNVDRIVYASEAGAAHHRRAGFPDDEPVIIPPGLDAARFKPDTQARDRIRDQLQLDAGAFVIGMVAPFQAEQDHPTFLKAIGELLKLHPNVALVLAGHGLQKGNAPLVALLGSGSLATRTHLLGERSDLNSLFNGCDLVCSSALNDASRMTLVMAMLCGVPCVATGLGAQGEVLGKHGVAIESGSPAAFVKGITRVMELTPDKRAAMAQGARKHAMQNYVFVRSLQRYLQLYYDLIGRQALAAPAPLPSPALETAALAPRPVQESSLPKKPAVTIAELSDPDSLEEKVAEHSEPLPKWRLQQEQQRAKREQELPQQVAPTQTAADVLEVFEAELARPRTGTMSAGQERARGVADDIEELLPAEMLAAPVGSAARASATTAETPSAATLAAVSDAKGKQAAQDAPASDLSVDEPQQLALIANDAVPPVPNDAVQLDLLGEPTEPRKRAVGEPA